MSASVDRRILRVSDVAEECGIAEKTVRGWILEGKLRASRPSKRMYLIQRRHLDDFLKRHEVREPGRVLRTAARNIGRARGHVTR